VGLGDYFGNMFRKVSLLLMVTPKSSTSSVCSTSLKMAPFDRSYTTSYQCAIVGLNVAISCTIYRPGAVFLLLTV